MGNLDSLIIRTPEFDGEVLYVYDSETEITRVFSASPPSVKMLAYAITKGNVGQGIYDLTGFDENEEIEVGQLDEKQIRALYELSFLINLERIDN